MAKRPKALDFLDAADIHPGSYSHTAIIDLINACQEEEEIELLELTWRGWSQAEIADHWGVNQATVSRHIKALVKRASSK